MFYKINRFAIAKEYVLNCEQKIANFMKFWPNVPG